MRFSKSITLIRAAVLTLLIVAFSAINGGCQSSSQEKTGNNNEAVMTDKQLEGYTNAPDFPSRHQWLNTDHPLSIKDFQGKLVLLDFWTFCCINCMHVIPDLKKLEEKYPEELVVIGVHSAKFSNEQQSSAIREAILRYGIEHPVINDRDFKVWSEYGARAWPTLVLINPNGKIIGGHSGEGAFDAFDPIISEAIAYFDKKGELKRSRLSFALEKNKQPNTLLSFPGKVSADPAANRLYITDSNHDRIIITDLEGNVVEIIGSGMNGAQDGSFEEASFNRPQGTFASGDKLYIADTENHVIRVADLAGRTVTTILGTGAQARRFNVSGTGTSVALNSPWDVLVHGDYLYIAMAGSHQIWRADLSSMHAEPFAGSGREDRIDGNPTDAALAQPSGLTTDGKYLYFADSETSSIRRVPFDDGRVETLIGEALFEYGDIDGGINKARLQHPLGVAYRNGKVYVADTYNSKVKIVDPENKTVKTYAGTGKAGDKDGKVSSAQFNEPGGLAFAGDTVYVADVNNHRVRIIDLNTNVVSSLEIKNIEMMAKREADSFTGRVVELPAHDLAPGKVSIDFNITLPKGYHPTDEAPFYFEPQSGDDNIVKFNYKNGGGGHFPIKLDVISMPGMTELTFDAVVYFCQEGSSQCLFDEMRVKVPVTVKEKAPEQFAIDVNAVTP